MPDRLFRLARWCLFMLPVLAELAVAGGGGIAAQQALSREAARPSVLGFAYGWDRGIVVDGDGVRMTEPPTVRRVREGSPAAAAGLRTGDVIISVNGRDSRETGVLRDIGAGQKVVLVVLRSGEQRRIEFTTSRPEGG